MRLPRLVAPALLTLAIATGSVWMIQQLVRTQRQHFFTPGEAKALAFLDGAKRRGPVLAAAMPLGQAVPAFTGRQTYVGHYYWTPDYGQRVTLAESLLDGRLAPKQATAHCSRGRLPRDHVGR